MPLLAWRKFHGKYIGIVLKRIAIFTFRIFDIKMNEYPIILFFNNILKLTDYKPNCHQNRLQKHVKVFSTSTKIENLQVNIHYVIENKLTNC